MTRSDPQRQRGIVLVVTLFFAVTVFGLAMALTYSTTATLNLKRRTAARSRATEAAESALHHLVGALNGPGEAALIAAGELSGTISGDDGSTRAVRYEVKFRPAGSDGRDNDLDGTVDESDESTTYEALAVGYCDSTFSAVSTTVRKPIIPVTMPGGLVWDNPKNTLQLDSTGDKTTLLISGIDQTLGGVPTGIVAPGIAVTKNHTSLANSIPLPRYQNDIVGTGSYPSISTASSSFDMTSVVMSVKNNYDLRLNKQGIPSKSTPQPWGTPESPMLVFATGDYTGDHIDIDDRKIVGAGILVVDGSLEVSDARAVVDWKGLVIIRSKLLVNNGATFKVTGGMVLYGPQQHSQIDDATVTIQYSTEALSRAMGAKPGGYEVFNWREAAVPPSIPQGWVAAGQISQLEVASYAIK